ncbi:uncharacterized protein [Watersipora subatra]|uniref:uncharacterized protein n=1 Tax=Watersipora subatra TaxID=2589382 RepID=UPI00355B4039
MPPRRRRKASPEPMAAGGVSMDQLAQVLANVNLNRQTTFKLPRYDGSGDVELYLQQFVDISATNQWEEGASLLHLKCALEGAAAARSRGETLEIIFQVLQIDSVADVVTAAQEYFQVGNNSGKSKHQVASVEVDQVSVKNKSPMELVMEKMLQQIETNTKVVQQLQQQKPINTSRSSGQASNNGPRIPLQCYGCGGPHLKRNCFALKTPMPKAGNGESPKQISKGVRDQLMPNKSQGRLTYGSQMEISETIELAGRLRDIAFVSEFLVCPVTEDAILGMPLLENNACVMDFRLHSLKMKGRELKCANRFGDRLESKVQVVHKVTIPSHSEMIMKGRLCGKTTNRVGVVDRWEKNPKAAPGLLLGKCLAKEAIKLCTTDRERCRIGKLLMEFQDVFSRSDADVGRTHLIKHLIPVKPRTRPIKQPPRRLRPEKEAEVERQRIDESIGALARSKIFSTLDLISRYWELPLDEDAQDKSSFVTRDGLWKWTLLSAVFECLRAAGLKLKPRKCDLFKAEVKYLGHVMSADGVATHSKKIVDVKEWLVPKCVRELKAFLGTAGYYRQYVPNFSVIASPLNRITSLSASFCWLPEGQKLFETLKECLVTSEVLGYPDPSLSFILDTDASAEDGKVVRLEKQQPNDVADIYEAVESRRDILREKLI